MNASGKSELPLSDALLRFANFMRWLVIKSLGKLLYKLGFTANATTWTGAVIFVSGCLIWPSHHWIGLFVAVIGAWFDVADGAVAKLSNNRTVYGGILDSSMDRIMDGAIFMALSLVVETKWEIAIFWIAAFGSFMVSYSRSRAEIHGIRGNVGLGGREVRLPVMAIGILLSMIFDWRYVWTAVLVSVLSWGTFVYRLYRTKKGLIEQNKNKLPV
jgi:phosphatidylglycerophosphate synthase